MRVLVCGGRDFDDWPLFCETLKRFEIDIVVSGDAPGADTMALEWCEDAAVPLQRHVANWSEFGRAAGPIRNQAMLDEGKPDLVIAFPGGRGTADMVRRARAAGVKVIEVEKKGAHDKQAP